jgi:hypothetical protein
MKAWFNKEVSWLGLPLYPRSILVVGLVCLPMLVSLQTLVLLLSH